MTENSPHLVYYLMWHSHHVLLLPWFYIERESSMSGAPLVISSLGNLLARCYIPPIYAMEESYNP